MNEVRIGNLESRGTRPLARFELDVGAMLVAWSESVLRPNLILDRRRRLLWANHAAHTVLARGDDIRLQGGCISLNDAEHLAAFDKWLSSMDTAGGSWCYPRSNGDGCLIFHAQMIDHGDGAIGLSLAGTGSDYAPVWVDFSPIFSLTPSEHRLVRMLLDGQTAEDAARALGISIETARTHIRRAYAKMGVGTREAMFRLLAPFRLR